MNRQRALNVQGNAISYQGAVATKLATVQAKLTRVIAEMQSMREGLDNLATVAGYTEEARQDVAEIMSKVRTMTAMGDQLRAEVSRQTELSADLEELQQKAIQLFMGGDETKKQKLQLQSNLERTLTYMVNNESRTIPMLRRLNPGVAADVATALGVIPYSQEQAALDDGPAVARLRAEIAELKAEVAELEISVASSETANNVQRDTIGKLQVVRRTAMAAEKRLRGERDEARSALARAHIDAAYWKAKYEHGEATAKYNHDLVVVKLND